MIGEEAADVGVGRPALLHGGDDGGEVIVKQVKVGGLAVDVGAGAADGDADGGLLQGRGVVDPVAGHRDHVATCLQGCGDAELVLRGHPGHDRAVAVQQLTQPGLVGGQLVPDEHQGCRATTRGAKVQE